MDTYIFEPFHSEKKIGFFFSGAKAVCEMISHLSVHHAQVSHDHYEHIKCTSRVIFALLVTATCAPATRRTAVKNLR